MPDESVRGTWPRELRRVGLAAWRGVGELYNSDGLTHAAAIAYYALLSLFPFFLLLLSLLGTLTADQGDRDTVVDFIFRYFPRQFDFMTRQLDAFRGQTVRIGVGGAIALTWASLGVFNAISSAVNHAWGVERRRSFLKHRLMSFVMLLSASGIFVIALALASLAKVAETSWFWGLVTHSPWLSWVSGLSGTYAATGLLIGCVALVFYFVPNAPVRFRDVWPGAIMTGLLWRGALAAFSWYARDLATWNLIHGSIAAVVVFLIWIYVSAVILLYGVEVTASYARMREALARHPALPGTVS
ncbi:MAG: YihY/virulence factor BrkB family protein [Vicinamibacterales bacterium]